MRHINWVEKMWQVIDDHVEKKFNYGEMDCCIFSARVVDAMCGTEHEKLLCQNYSDESTARAYIEKYDGLENAVSEYIGQSKVGRAQRGDVVMFKGANGDTLGICVGNSIASVYDDGVVFVPRSFAICYWSI